MRHPVGRPASRPLPVGQQMAGRKFVPRQASQRRAPGGPLLRWRRSSPSARFTKQTSARPAARPLCPPGATLAADWPPALAGQPLDVAPPRLPLSPPPAQPRRPIQSRPVCSGTCPLGWNFRGHAHPEERAIREWRRSGCSWALVGALGRFWGLLGALWTSFGAPPLDWRRWTGANNREAQE